MDLPRAASAMLLLVSSLATGSSLALALAAPTSAPLSSSPSPPLSSWPSPPLSSWPSPPLSSTLRGANSWDSWLGNPNETEVLSIGAFLASTLLPFGFSTFVIDAGWANFDNGTLSLDAYGRYTPRTDEYPSASGGAGFLPLSTQMHSLGLRLGAWTIRGIPKQAAAAKAPIFNSTFTADQAVRTDRPCGWDDHCYGCASANPDGTGGCNAAAWAYYRSLAASYRAQGLDVVKLDCMWPADHGPQGWYDDDDLAMTTAFREQGFLISLSPGRNVSPQNGTWVAAAGLADQYRVTEDFWDTWDDHYVSGLRTKLDVAVEFASFFFGSGTNNGTSADLDMLQLGRVMSGQHPPLVPANLTADEQRLEVTLWCAVGAPLFIGARLPFDVSIPADALALELLTNPEVLLVHNESSLRTPITPLDADQTYAWASTPFQQQPGGGPSRYLSLFNGDDEEHVVAVRLADAGLPVDQGLVWCARDLWARSNVEGANYTEWFSFPVRPHAAGMWLLSPCAS
jgi:hypothetical protein